MGAEFQFGKIKSSRDGWWVQKKKKGGLYLMPLNERYT